MKSLRWRKTGIILGVPVILLIAATLILPRLIDLNRYHDLIASQLENALGGEVVLGPLAWGIADGIWLQADGLSIEGATAFPGDLALGCLHARVSLLPLLSRRVVVDELLLESPLVTIRLLPTPPKREEEEAGPAGAPPNVEILIEKLRVRKGRIRLEDSLTLPGEQVEKDFTDVLIEATQLAPGHEMTLQLALRDASEPGLGSLKGEGTFVGLTEAFTLEDPRLSVSATLSDLDVETLEPYLKDESLLERLGGSISLVVNYQGDLGQHFRVDGHIDLTDFAYTDPSMWEESLPGTKTTIAYEATFDPDEVRIERLEVSSGNISVSLEALLPDWRKGLAFKDAVLSSELPLVELIPFVPWKKLGDEGDAIRQSLAGGGKIILERAAFPELSLTRMPDDWKPFLSGVEGSIELSDISVKPSPLLPRLEHVNGHLHLEKGVLRAENMQARMGPLTLPTLHLNATDLLGKPKVSVVAKGPMRLVASHDAQVEKLLMEYGLEGLTGRTEFDMLVHYDHAKPKDWDARVDVVLEGVSADYHAGNFGFADLRGRVNLRREKGLVIVLENLKGRMNQSPIYVDGKLSTGGTQRFVVDGRARTEGLDLALARVLYPPVKDMELGGNLDLDVNVHYSSNDPMATRLEGNVEARDLGVRLDAQSIKVTDGEADIELAGNTVNLKGMTFRVNEQPLNLSGQVTVLREPKVLLHVASPDLNVDRLLPPVQETQPSSQTVVKEEDTPEKAAGITELPPLLRRLTAQVQADVTRGEYRGQAFQDMQLQAEYERGVLKSHAFDVDIAGGHVGSTGSVDLTNLEGIFFSVKPTVSTVPVESIARLLGIDEVSVRGPLTMTGQVQGKTGSVEEVLESLEGSLEGQMGPGKMLAIGPGGNALLKMLALTNVSHIIVMKSMVDLRTDGLPYDSIHATTSFEDGNLNFIALHLKSPSLEVEATSKVDLANQQVKGSANVIVLGAVDKGLGYVPLVGGAVASIIKVYMNIDGPLENPKITPALDKKATDAAGNVIQAPREIGKKAIKGVEKGLDKIF